MTQVGRYPTERLGALIKRIEAGVSVNAEDRIAQPGEHGVLKVSAVGPGRFRSTEHKAVLPRELERLGRQGTLSAGDILVTRANTLDLVGAAAVVGRDHPTLHLSDKTWRIVPRDSDSGTRDWLPLVLNSSWVRMALRKRATGTSGSMKNVGQGVFLAIDVPVPPVSQRVAIAEAMSPLTQYQGALEALLFALHARKRGLMQQLLTGKLRFPGEVGRGGWRATRFGQLPAEWAYPAIGEIAEEVVERAVRHPSAEVLSCSKYDGLVDSEIYFGKQVYSKDRSQYKVVRRGQFAFPANHIEEGSIGLLNHRDIGVVSPIYVVFQPSEEVEADFLYAVLKSDTHRHIFATATNSSVNRRGSLRWRDFARLHIPLPSRSEQRRIAILLALLTKEIGLLERQLELFALQCRAVSEKLLSGEVQVPEGHLGATG